MPSPHGSSLPDSRRIRLLFVLLTGLLVSTIHPRADATGQFTLAPPYYGDLWIVGESPADGMIGMAFMPNGDMWVTEGSAGNRLRRYSGVAAVHGSNVHQLAQTVTIPGATLAYGMVNHPDGFAYGISDLGIFRFNMTSGTLGNTIDAFPAGDTPSYAIAVDPVLVAGVKTMLVTASTAGPNQDLLRYDPTTGAFKVVYTAPSVAWDAIAIDASGQFLFVSEPYGAGGGGSGLTVLQRSGNNFVFVRKIPGFGPDGVVFNACEGCVIANCITGNLVRYDFPNGYANAPMTPTVIGSNGFRGDFAQVNPYDQHAYCVQTHGDNHFNGTRYDDGALSDTACIVRLGPCFATATPQASTPYQLASADLLQDAFPSDLTINPGSPQFDFATALVKTGRNTAPHEADPTRRWDVPGDSLVVCGCEQNARVDLVFRIDPGPGNFVVPGDRASGLRQNPQSIFPTASVPGDASFWGQYMANPGAFGTPGGHHGGTRWDPNTWNSARMDTAELNLFPVLHRGNVSQLQNCRWASTYHEADPKFSVLGILKNECFLVDPNGPIDATNISCNIVPSWVSWPMSGWSGTSLTREFTKILPDGLFTPGTHIEYFIRSSSVPDPLSAILIPDTAVVAPQPFVGGTGCGTPIDGAGARDWDRWEEFSVLPDRWKATEYGGQGMACMLVVDLHDGYGEERAWTVAAELLGLTVPAKHGAHNGWHVDDFSTRPTTSAGFVSTHGGQAGTYWDKYEVRGSDDPIDGFAGSIGSRYGYVDVAPGNLLYGKQAQIGPSYSQLLQYYQSIVLLSGSSVGPLGPRPQRSQPDITLLTSFLQASSAGQPPHALVVSGSRFAQEEDTAPDPSHSTFLSDMLALNYVGEYGPIAGPAAPCTSIQGTGLLDPTPSTCGVVPTDANAMDVLLENTTIWEAAPATRASSVSLPEIDWPVVSVAKAPSSSRPWVSIVDGFDLQALADASCAGFTGPLPYLAEELRAILHPTCSLWSPGWMAAASPGSPPQDGMRLLDHPVRGGAMRVRLDVARAGPVSLRVVDVAGRIVHTLEEGPMQAGSQVVRWDGRTRTGDRIAAGVYFLDARFGEGRLVSKRLVIVR